MEELFPVFTILLGALPTLIATLVGIVLAGVFWSRATRPAALVMVACVLQILLLMASAIMSGWYVPHAARDDGMLGIRTLMMLWGVGSNLIHAIVFGLLLWAVFAGRASSAPANR